MRPAGSAEIQITIVLQQVLHRQELHSRYIKALQIAYDYAVYILLRVSGASSDGRFPVIGISLCIYLAKEDSTAHPAG